MRVLIAASLSLALGSGAAAQASARTDAARLIGTWRLVSIASDSATAAMRGPHPTGLIIYDATGHMAVQIQPDRRRTSWPQGQAPTAQQAVDAAAGYTAYFGTYVINDQAHTVTHHREGALNFDFVDYVRRYEFQGTDRLVLQPVDRPESRLVWERIK